MTSVRVKKSALGVKKPTIVDYLLMLLLVIGVVSIIVPFINVLAISFATEKEYHQTSWLMWPQLPTLRNFEDILLDERIWVGYKTTIVYILIGVPMNLFLDCCVAYALYRNDWPGKRIFFYFMLITMLFGGGLIPTYLVLKQLGLIGTIWAVILPSGLSTFNAILICNYMRTIPTSLVEAADLDGASEWDILFRIVIPLCKPILATVSLFVAVGLWNEYFASMIYLKSGDWMSLQQVLRSIINSGNVAIGVKGSMSAIAEEEPFTEGIKMAAIFVTMVPVMCVYPFLQKYFTKGIMIGAVKA